MRDRKELVDEYRMIRFLSEVLTPVRHPKHKAVTKDFSQYYSPGKELNDLLLKLKMLREKQRSVTPKSLRRITELQNKLKLQVLLGAGPESRRLVYFKYGDGVGGTRTVEQNRAVFHIRIGRMWLRKVYKPIYEAMTNVNLGPWVILQAEPVRVNSKWIRLFEVLVFNRDNGHQKRAYVAKTKSDKMSVCLGDTAALAISKAERELEQELNNMFVKGTNHD